MLVILLLVVIAAAQLVSAQSPDSIPRPGPPRPPSGNPPPGVLKKLLFPGGGRMKNGWSTASRRIPGMERLPLNDTVLGVHRVSSGTTHNVTEIAGKTAWEAFYPLGSRNPSGPIRGGFGFYAYGPASWNITYATEAIFSYAILFEQGFQWQLGGKIPGFFGGVGDLAYGCSGGRQTDRDKCFDLRYMWRANGAGELYAYLPPNHPDTDAKLLAVPPQSIKNNDFGFSVGRGSWTFPAGEWTYISQRSHLNTPGIEDGWFEIYINGKLVIGVYDITLRETLDSVYKGVHFQTFFGGGSDPYNSPADQYAYFADISGAFVE